MTIDELLPNAPRSRTDALALFDSASTVEPEFMLGTWRGAELATGHPLDGMLGASGWWGKQFDDAETVHPLLFRTGDGTALWALNPALAFGGIGVVTKLPSIKKLKFGGPIAALRPVLQTRKPRARLRTTRYRGTDTATMMYDQLPINDVFRSIDGPDGADDTVIGAMDLRGSEHPYFFVLQRDKSLRLS